MLRIEDDWPQSYATTPEIPGIITTAVFTCLFVIVPAAFLITAFRPYKGRLAAGLVTVVSLVGLTIIWMFLNLPTVVGNLQCSQVNPPEAMTIWSSEGPLRDYVLECYNAGWFQTIGLGAIGFVLAAVAVALPFVLRNRSPKVVATQEGPTLDELLTSK